MKILICGPEGSGKTTLAKPFAELLGAVYVNKDTYADELKGYVDGLVAAGKTVVIDKRCNTNEAVEYLDPDYVVWMDMRTVKTEKPSRVDYHVAEWFDDTDKQLLDVVKRYMEKKNA
jgi:broad-specificity NMP kinase